MNDTVVTEEQLKTCLGSRKLKKGAHRKKSVFDPPYSYDDHECEVCAAELLSQVLRRGDGISDYPLGLHTWDFRSLNDFDVSDDLRTEVMLPIIAGYSGCLDWKAKDQMLVLNRLIQLTFERCLDEPDMPDLFDDLSLVRRWDIENRLNTLDSIVLSRPGSHFRLMFQAYESMVKVFKSHINFKEMGEADVNPYVWRFQQQTLSITNMLSYLVSGYLPQLTQEARDHSFRQFAGCWTDALKVLSKEK